MFEALGLSKVEEQVYQALIRTHARTLDELSLEVPHSADKVSMALARLEGLGLARRQARGGPYVPMRPDTAFDVLLHRHEEAIDQARKDVAGLVEEFRHSDLAAHPANFIEVIAGEADVEHYTMDLHLRPKTTLMAFDTPPYSVDIQAFDEVGAQEPQLRSATRWRVIYSTAALDVPGRFEKISTLAALGEESRVLDSLPTKVLIIDESLAIIPLTTTDHATQSIAVVHQSRLLDALMAMFEAHWRLASPLPQPAERASEVTTDVTDEDLRVLGMLATGMTDEAIAHQLQVSQRTGRRRITRALKLVGGQSRFQAGVNACKSGLI